MLRSPRGDVDRPDPPTVTADRFAEPFNLVPLACKAYDLDAVMVDMASAVGPGTAVLPLLNGLCHLDALDARFGAARVLGWLCAMPTTADLALAILDECAAVAARAGLRPTEASWPATARPSRKRARP